MLKVRIAVPTNRLVRVQASHLLPKREESTVRVPSRNKEIAASTLKHFRMVALDTEHTTLNPWTPRNNLLFAITLVHFTYLLPEGYRERHVAAVISWQVLEMSLYLINLVRSGLLAKLSKPIPLVPLRQITMVGVPLGRPFTPSFMQLHRGIPLVQNGPVL